jgi:bifunctional NMN adenylyltransferase/nudix hydrolase
MKEERKKYDIGVIIGRFQIHELHSEHKAMIDEVLSRHDKVIMFLGVGVAQGTKRNPLDFLSRKKLIEEVYKNDISVILPIYDNRSDEKWSKTLDEKIREIDAVASVVLYGSRDSFIPFYHGKFDTIELAPEREISASEIRIDVSKRVERDKAFRAGVIYGAYNRFPITHPVVDVAIMNDDESEVLLGRKKDEKPFRFVGGFVDVTDKSYEQTVRREVMEETGVEVDNITYLTSMSVNDWRYNKDTDRSIMTSFFKAKKIFGAAKANDDIIELKWFKLSKLEPSDLVPEHGKLIEILKNNINKNNNKIDPQLESRL